MARLLVTGGAGFIGTHVVRQLAERGDEVCVLDCLHPLAHGQSASPPASPGEMLVGDLRDPSVVRAAVRDVDAVIHQAAMVGMGVDLGDAPDYVGCNDLGTAVLLAEMARAGVARLVLASSMVVYGEGAYDCPEHGAVRPARRSDADLRAGFFEPRCLICAQDLTAGRVDEHARLEPRSIYAATKLAQEHLAGVWAATTGGSALALRYHNVYGPGMPRDTPYSGVAAIFRSALESGRAPRVFEDGRQRRDFIHVADVARANLAALDDRRPGFHAYNVATGKPHTVGEMAGVLADAMGGPAPVITAEYRAGDVRHVLASPLAAVRDLGFVASIPFAAGMAEFATAPLRDAPACAGPVPTVDAAAR